MAGRRWGLALLVLGGMAVGVAVAGVPSRRQDPPLRIDASATSTTSSAASVPVSTTSTTSTVPAGTPGASP